MGNCTDVVFCLTLTDYIALGCVGSVNVNPDWRTYVYQGGADGAKPDVETETPFFSHSLGPGSMIFLDDGKCLLSVEYHDKDGSSSLSDLGDTIGGCTTGFGQERPARLPQIKTRQLKTATD